ncbi:MAG: polysaccharide biosynthesis tyrosine autokinase [Verrucomicrobiae bacterium]|nr:polysaccharide biosynthesis tyrosine autokinase [Verrucomicrobiae bacterium]
MQDQSPPTHDRSTRSAHFFNYLHRYLALLRKCWWVVALTVALGLGFQAYRIYTAPMTYQSVARMIVSIKIQNLPTGAVYTEELSNFLGTQQALMKSGTVLNRAFERVQANKPDLAASPVDLQISVSPKTTIFNLVATGIDPEYTRAFLDACMEEYINLKKEMRMSTSETTLAGITAQLVSLERDLKKQEAELLDFQGSNSLVFLQEQGNSAGSYLVKLNQTFAVLKTELQLLNLLDLDQTLERQQKPTAVVAGDSSWNDAGSLNPLHSDYLKARQEIQLRKAELQEWSEVYRPKHPRIVSLNDEIARREKLLEIFRQQSLEQLENRRSSLALQMENLEREIKEWEVKSLEISRKMAEFERLRANKQRTQGLYDRLLAAMQTLDVDKDLSQESVTPLERASLARPARGNALQTMTIAGLLGLLAGVALLLLVDRFDDRPASFTDLQDMFDEHVLGQIPLQQVTKSKTKAGVPLVQPNDDRHTFVEAYRNVRSSLLYMATEGKRPRTIVVTSAIPGEGKSLTAANLAITMAQAGSRVVLVDADLRKGQLHQRFGVNASPGLEEVLAEGVPLAQALQPTPVSNLMFVPRGKTSRNPGELFLTQSTLDLIKELSAQHDYVIIDTAPVMAVDDVTSLAHHAEGVVFVLRARFTSARVARAALELLYQREADVLGLVFNGVQVGRSDYYYYKYKEYYTEYRSA